MPITKRTVVDQTSVDEFGNISVRTATVIEDDGVEISRTFHREVLEPNADTTNHPAIVKAVSSAVWTPAVKAAHAVKKAARAQ